MVATGRLEAAANRLLPRWMRGVWFDKLWTALLHGPLEALDQDKVNAVNVGLVERCPADAVRYHAAERQLERLEGESDEALRTRAQGAWGFWSELAPTSKLVEAVELYTGLSGITIYAFTVDDWYLGEGHPANGGDDNNDENWSRHVIIIPAAAHSWTRPVVGPGLTVGPGLMVGLTMTQSELSGIRRAYRRHRPAHMVGADIYVIFDAATAADVLADHDDASADYSRLPLHRQMVGYGPHGMAVGPHLIVGYEFT